jgi:hypothetical protein
MAAEGNGDGRVDRIQRSPAMRHRIVWTTDSHEWGKPGG